MTTKEIEESNRQYRQEILDAGKVPAEEKSLTLWLAGFFENYRGRWHPPSCTASWPIDEAYAMVIRDKKNGRHVIDSYESLARYHRDIGVRKLLTKRFYNAEVKRLEKMIAKRCDDCGKEL